MPEGVPTDRLLFDEHNRVELRALADAGAVVVVPVGATEQHGPHLPVATDWWHVEWVAGGERPSA